MQLEASCRQIPELMICWKPFALSLSKCISVLSKQEEGFDKLSPNGDC